MNNKSKIAAGTSVTGIVILAFHLFHVAYSIDESSERNKLNKMVQNATVTIILTDSTGKKDTMLMKDYLKKMK